MERRALIFHCHPKWDVAIWGALIRIATLYLYTIRWPYFECSTVYRRVPYSDCSSPYSRVSYSDCPSPYSWLIYPYGPTWYSWVSYSECPTSYSWVSFSKCPTLYKCALLCIDAIWSPTLYKNPTPVGAVAKKLL